MPPHTAEEAGHLRGEPHPAGPHGILIYGESDSELNCILVAGIKRAFLPTTHHILGILPLQNIPESKCSLGHSPWGGGSLGGHVAWKMAFPVLHNKELSTQ